MGMGMLFLAVFAILQGLTNFGLMQIGGILFIVYCTWAIGQFFDRKKPLNYFKAFASYTVGMITFMIAAILLGVSIDLIIKL
jgi:energy-converting hydrogenase Eha subunit C